jgi:hypothetical protein
MSAIQRMTAVAVLLSGLLLGGVVPVRADRRGDCVRDIHRAELRLQRAIDRHGEDSPQAEARRHELREVRERCHEYDHERHEEREHERHEEHEMHEHGY